HRHRRLSRRLFTLSRGHPVAAASRLAGRTRAHGHVLPGAQGGLLVMSVTTGRIRAFDCVEQHAAIQDEILAAVQDVLASGSLILGPRVRSFEERFARFLEVPGHAVTVGNGTDALAIALRALGVGQGDEVITVANTAVPTATAIAMTGARPVF